MSLKGSNDNDKLKDLYTKSYKDQAIWFLNAYWKQFGEKEAENIWTYAHKMVELDKDKGKEGNQLDEFHAHRFLESFKDPLTVLEMREKLFKVGIEKSKYVALTAYLVSHYSADWHYLVNAPQGDNQNEVIEAQRLLDSVMKAFSDVQNTAQAAATRESEARNAETAAKEAKVEQQKSLEEVQAQENARNNKTAELERKSTEGGQVSQNKAKAELAQHLAEDPLPLRRAKISNEAAVKKADKAARAAEEAVAAAIAARAAAEKALEEAQLKVAEAEKYLDEVRSKPGSAGGALWWIDRELHEARAYLPTSKGGYAKKNVRVDA
eukprot:TRINITY_DN9_c0_g2_i1.p1 TRINITY_DN9_c0_g2~~TRINITY_DN9_c0_g2_i1.p1  ORF type:complete len:323 (-),score=128.24 TRINITY_DN9_c0_g2_i1:90-1058(-)